MPELSQAQCTSFKGGSFRYCVNACKLQANLKGEIN